MPDDRDEPWFRDDPFWRSWRRDERRRPGERWRDEGGAREDAPYRRRAPHDLRSVGSPGIGGGTRGDEIARAWARELDDDPWSPYEPPARRRHGGGFAGRGPKGYVRPDARILEDVCDRLTVDDDVDATDVEVRVEGGEVTIAGTVATRSMKRRAEELVEDVAGVKDVHNQLRVPR